MTPTIIPMQPIQPQSRPVRKSPNGKACLNRRLTLCLNLFLLVALVTFLPAIYFYSNALASAPFSIEGLMGPPSSHGAAPSPMKAERSFIPLAPPSDGTFNGFNVSYRDPSSPPSVPLHSTVHCMGENFGERSWLHRSCSFLNLCFDLEEREFILFRSNSETSLMTSIGHVLNK